MKKSFCGLLKSLDMRNLKIVECTYCRAGSYEGGFMDEDILVGIIIGICIVALLLM